MMSFVNCSVFTRPAGKSSTKTPGAKPPRTRKGQPIRAWESGRFCRAGTARQYACGGQCPPYILHLAEADVSIANPFLDYQQIDPTRAWSRFMRIIPLAFIAYGLA